MLIAIIFLSDVAMDILMFDTGFNFASMVIVFSKVFIEVVYNIKTEKMKTDYFFTEEATTKNKIKNEIQAKN